MIYHYTDRHSAEDIIRGGVIRATPITLHRDLFARDDGLITPAIVWLTINPILDGTVEAKMMGPGGWKKLDGNLYRFTVGDDWPVESLADFTERVKIEHSWWDMAVKTGAMAGSDYTTWRLSSDGIPASAWLSIEVLDGYNDDSTTAWRVK